MEGPEEVNLNKRGHLEELGIDGMIILKLLLELGLDSACLAQDRDSAT
jgi:hypothetical protein